MIQPQQMSQLVDNDPAKPAGNAQAGEAPVQNHKTELEVHTCRKDVGKAENTVAGAGAEQIINNRPVMIENHGIPLPLGLREKGNEVGLIHIERQLLSLSKTDRGRFDFPLLQCRADEIDSLRLVIEPLSLIGPCRWR